jgi:hypothetical protein
MASGKKAGRKSQASNDFLEPSAPTGVTATNVGTARAFNNGSATVSFSLPALSPAATSFTVTSSPGSFTGTGSSSPVTVTGLQSNTAYTFTVTATNAAGTSAASEASASITATTVPATPAAPTIDTVAQTATDVVTWVAPATGGSTITGYTWASNDSKTGTVSGSTLSANVAQEAGTAQAYTVYATNANGNSSTSTASASFTSFTFTPFAVFGFAPIPFAVFGFAPIPFAGVFGFAPIPFAGVFGFAPIPFGGVFGFWPYSFGFSVWGDSLAVQTKVLTPTGVKFIEDLVVGDTVYAMNLGGDSTTNWLEWSSSDIQLDNDLVVETTVVSVTPGTAEHFIHINGNLYTPAHYLLVKKDGITKFLQSPNVDTTYEVYNYEHQAWLPVTTVEEVNTEMEKISINCEPYDNFFTENMLVFDRPDS